jgi:hypothetical protein
MDADAADREAINLLIRELTAKPAAGKPSVSQAASTPPPAPQSTPAARPVVASQALRPGRRWTNVRLLMPARPAAAWAPPFAFGHAATLPHVSTLSRSSMFSRFFDLSRVFRTPGPVTMARMWAGLAAAYSASLTFWPYPKTYLWGMVLYLLCLGLALVASVWGARLSWDARLGGAHTVALGTALWAVMLGTVLALPLA